MAKPLNYKEFVTLALKYYAQGGDTFYECWDEREFNEYVTLFGHITKSKALKMFEFEFEMEKEWAGWH